MTVKIEPGKKYFFRDKDEFAGQNYLYGFDYCGAGIVESIHLPEEGKQRSGKEIVVYYISPRGEVCREWRGLEEIHLTCADEADYEYLRSIIADFEDSLG